MFTLSIQLHVKFAARYFVTRRWCKLTCCITRKTSEYISALYVLRSHLIGLQLHSNVIKNQTMVTALDINVNFVRLTTGKIYIKAKLNI